MVIRPGASAAQRWQALQATRQTEVAASPSRRFRHWTSSWCSSGMTTKRSLGQASTQSLQAVHFAGSTTGSPTSFMTIAPKVQARRQSARPRQPQVQPLPPPATAAAAAQVERPRYSACCTATSLPPAQRRRATRWVTAPASTPRYAATSARWSAFMTVHPAGATFPATTVSAKPRQPG